MPALVIGHPADPIHPAADAAMLAAEMPNATFVQARSILEWRVTPERLDRAAPLYDGAEFLKTRAAEDLVRRLEAILRDFPLAVDLGARNGAFAVATYDVMRGSRRSRQVMADAAFGHMPNNVPPIRLRHSRTASTTSGSPATQQPGSAPRPL